MKKGHLLEKERANYYVDHNILLSMQTILRVKFHLWILYYCLRNIFEAISRKLD